ncbi:hypothetical protein OQA88_1240 [Cercophora sp. LCS_1]
MPVSGKPGAGMASNGRWASDNDFNKYRHVITELYHQNNMTLPDIMSTMETRYGFSATTKMYKTRFRRWGLWKHAPCPASNEPSAVVLSMQTPVRLQGEEAAHRALRDYYDGSFLMHRWQSQEIGPARLTREDEAIKSGVGTYVRFRTAVSLLERPSRGNNGGKAGDFAQGVRLMRTPFAELPGILARGESPLLPLWLIYITTLFRESSARDFRPVEIQLLRHLQVLQTPWPLSPWTVDLNGLAIGLIHPNGQGNPDDKTVRFRQLFQNLETHEPRYDLRHINTLCCWASHYRHHGGKQGRVDILEEGISMVEGVLSDPAKAAVIDEYLEGAYNMYILLASMNHKLGRMDVAEDHVRHAIGLARRHWEETGEENDLFEGMNGLEIILRAQGKVVEADSVMVERKMLVRSTLEMVGEEEDSAGTGGEGS